MSSPPIVRTRLYGAGMLLAFAALLVLVGAMFTRALTPTVDVVLKTDRAGLLMAPKNDVRVRGVVIGRVGDVRLVGDRVEMSLKLDPDQVHLVPRNATARIEASTVFGNKFVSIVAPASGAVGEVRDGSVIEADGVAVEVNTVLANLVRVLDGLEPSSVNTTLDAMATAVSGRGDQLGGFLERTDSYLARLNPLLPEIRADLDGLAEVSHLYADVAPEFFEVVHNATVTGATVTQKQEALAAFLRELDAMGDAGGQVFTENGQSLVETLRLLQPTTSLLSEYSPMLSCFLRGEDYARTLLEPIFGGVLPAARFMVGILPGKDPYTYPDNLPEVGAATGPDCHGLPYLDGVPVPVQKATLPGTGAQTPAEPGPYRLDVGSNPAGLLVGPGAGGGPP